MGKDNDAHLISVAGDILQDLAQRRAALGDVVHRCDGVTVCARSPVATLVNYSSDLRRVTSGRAHFMMEIDGYNPMTEGQTDEIVSQLQVGGGIMKDSWDTSYE